MALPAPPTLGFSFTSFSTSNPTAQQPGGSLDAEFNRGYQATTDLIHAVQVSINADGTLNSAQVGAAYTAYIAGGGAGAGTIPDVSLADSQRYAEASQGWAEYTLGPLPANTLAVMGITGDHWSSRWWANEAAYNVAVQDKKLQDALAAGQLNVNAPDLPGGPITSLQNLTLVDGVLTALPPSAGSLVTSVNTRTDAVTLTIADIPGAAPLDSPNFTGLPTCPTQSPGLSNGRLANCAFVTLADQVEITARTTAINNEAAARASADALLAPKANPVFTGNVVSSTGNIYARGSGAVYFGPADESYIQGQPGYSAWVFNAGTSWQLAFNRSTHRLSFTDASAAELFAVDGAGNASATGNLIAANISANTISSLSATVVGPYAGYALTASGAVAFGATPVSYGLQASGSNVLALNFYAVSDVRFKFEIDDISAAEALDWLARSRPVTYLKRPTLTAPDADAIREAGFIAQEQVAAGFGRYVGTAPAPGLPARTDPDLTSLPDVMLTLSPTYQIAYLTRAVQALAAQIAALQGTQHKGGRA